MHTEIFLGHRLVVRIYDRNWVVLRLLFVVCEEPKFFVDDRSADGTSKLLEDIQRFRNASGLVNGIVGPSARVTVVIKSVTMKCVGTGLGHRVQIGRASCRESVKISVIA